jgi:hypothetical protein
MQADSVIEPEIVFKLRAPVEAVLAAVRESDGEVPLLQHRLRTRACSRSPLFLTAHSGPPRACSPTNRYSAAIR